MRLILASGSPRRMELLRLAGIDFDVVASGLEERVPEDADVTQIVESLALLKAGAVSRKHPSGLVLGADTSIDLEGEILGKPEDPEDAVRMLGRLRGRTHEVKTGLALVRTRPALRLVSSVSTHVRMRDYGETEIRRYVGTGEPLDKAGAYAIQERGGALVASIQGCYNNIVGLPLCEVAALLARAGRSHDAAAPVCRLPGGSACPRLC